MKSVGIVFLITIYDAYRGFDFELWGYKADGLHLRYLSNTYLLLNAIFFWSQQSAYDYG